MGIFSKLNKNKEMVIYSPIDGIVCPIEEVNDVMFSKKLMGNGIMIKPRNGYLYAPCNATVEMIFPTNHALGLKLKDGSELLIHFGLETVNLEGNGFELLVNKGDKVSPNTLLLKANLPYIKEHAQDDCVIMVFTMLVNEKELNISYGDLNHGDKIIKFIEGEN